jgi:cystathionine beta-synthase
VRTVVESKSADDDPLLYLNPDASVREAIDLMRRYDVSQLPVAKNDMPLAAAEVMGSVNELRLMEASFADKSVLDKPVEIIMGSPMPTIGAGQPIELAVELLDTAPALLVLDGGRPRTVITRSDLLNYLSPEDDS